MSHERIWDFLSSRYTNFLIIIIIIGQNWQEKDCKCPAFGA